MGMTMGCAQCHDHKYDPISQEEYFRMYAILNQTQDSDKSDNVPLLTTPIPEQEKQRVKVAADLAVLEKQSNQTSPELDASQKRWEAQAKKGKLPANINAILGID